MDNEIMTQRELYYQLLNSDGGGTTSQIYSAIKVITVMLQIPRIDLGIGVGTYLSNMPDGEMEEMFFGGRGKRQGQGISLRKTLDWQRKRTTPKPNKKKWAAT